ncbi:MAG: branched-chain amino acid ABC transporter permease [Candidatus Heimdallarchaeota archaeon]|nr:branched-chain amino acid ABC transporter permease [Candidatus Heimdallarchaeota archaeon]
MSENKNNDDVETETEVTSFYQRVKNKYSANQSLILMLAFGIPVFSAFFYPYFTNQFTGTGYYLLSFTLVFLFAAMTLSLNLEVGYLGLPNFGKVAFIAIGGYSYALSMMALTAEYSEGDPFFLGIKYTLGLGIVYSVVVAIIVTGIFGVILTIPTLRLSETYLAIVTIVAGEMLRFIAFNQEELGGFEGIRVGNPVHSQFDTQQIMGGYYLGLNTFIIMVGVLLLGHGLYYYIYRRQNDDDINRKIARATHRVLTFAAIAAMVVIGLEYFNEINERPTLVLHLFLILFIVTLIIYQSIRNFIATKIPLFNKLKPHRGIDLIFGINYLLVLLNYVRGLSVDRDTYQFRVFRLFTEISPLGGNFKFEPHFTIIDVEIIVINWFSMMVALFTLVIIYVIMEEIYYSPFGRTLRAIREDDTSATSVGKSIFSYRLRALIIASALAGFAGAMYVAITPTQANSQSYIPLLTFQLYIYLIVGGTGNNKGAVFGATIMVLLERVTKGTFVLDAKIWDDFTYPDGSRVDPINVGLIMAGVILVLFLIYAPDGIIPEVKYNNPRYYDMLAYTEKEREEDDKLLAALIKLSGTELETEEWI